MFVTQMSRYKQLAAELTHRWSWFIECKYTYKKTNWSVLLPTGYWHIEPEIFLYVYVFCDIFRTHSIMPIWQNFHYSSNLECVNCHRMRFFFFCFILSLFLSVIFLKFRRYVFQDFFCVVAYMCCFWTIWALKCCAI